MAICVGFGGDEDATVLGVAICDNGTCNKGPIRECNETSQIPDILDLNSIVMFP